MDYFQYYYYHTMPWYISIPALIVVSSPFITVIVSIIQEARRK